jgi:hypothetical protein
METVVPIKPLYLPEEGSDLIELGEAPIEIRADKDSIKAFGRAQIHLQPKFMLSITADLAATLGNGFALFDAGSVDFRFGSSVGFERANVQSTNLSSDGQLKVVLTPNPQKMVQGQENQQLASLLFHVINFPRFFGSGPDSQDIRHATSQSGWRLLGRVILGDALWLIELQEMPETQSVTEKLKETSGYGITHVGQIKRQDSAPFTSKEANNVLQDLHNFPGFANGAWSPPVLVVGFDAAGRRVYEQWGIRICTPWEVHRRWLDVHHGEFLRILYPGFCSLLNDPAMGRAVRAALYWYLRSNRGGEGAGIDSGIILSQAGLEELTAAYLEANGVPLATESRAANNLRETLSRLGIPTKIPDVLKILTDGKAQGGWDDGPQALTRVRNELTHPKNRLPFKVGNAVYETWNLSQWYIELIILKLAGYSGEYSNRLAARWVGQVEAVPWKE